MSLSYLRDNITKALQERADAASTRAMNNHPSTHNSADTYAMQSIDALSEARAYLYAIQIVSTEYKNMIEPEKKPDMDETQQARPKGESIYG